MGVKYLWDTNTVIYYLQGHFKHSAELFVDGLLTRSHPAISAITEVELLCWKTDNAQDLALLHSSRTWFNVADKKRGGLQKYPWTTHC
jgi:predicted nucleic acid-binding protein